MTKNPSGLISAVSLGGATVLVGWTLLTRPVDPRMTDEAVDVADFRQAVVPTPASARAESLRDAPASPAPVPIAGYSMTPRPSVVQEAAPPDPGRGVEQVTRRSPLFARLLERPASVLARGTVLGSPKDFRRFLADPGKVDAYLDSPLVRAALRSPTVAKLVLRNGGLVRAFLSTPAMSDPASVKALVGSKMFRKMVDCPGVQGALADPSVMVRLGSDPETLDFLSRNPAASRALAAAFPALARAFAKG